MESNISTVNISDDCRATLVELESESFIEIVSQQ